MRSSRALSASALLFSVACAESGSSDLDATLAFVTERLPEGAVNRPYSATIEVRAAPEAELEWTALSGPLPEGLELVASGTRAELRGIPRGVTEHTLRLLVVDIGSGANVEATFGLEIEAGPRLAIPPTALPPAFLGAPYRAQIAARLGGGADLRWTVPQGSLPPGLTLAPEGTPTTALTGTPSEAGRFSFQIAALDSAGDEARRDFVLEVTVEPEPLTIRVPPRIDGELGRPYSIPLGAEGGTGDVRWRVEGEIPGVTFGSDGRSARLEGTPSALGAFSVRIEVVDAAREVAAVELAPVIRTPLSIQTRALPSATVGEPYLAAVTATGAAAPVSWRIADGALPAGLSATEAGARLDLSGRASAAGVSAFTLEVEDGAARTATRAFTLEVVPPLEIPTVALADGVLGAAYSSAVQASGGRGPYTWTLVDAPPGLELSSDGSPQATLRGIAGNEGTFTVTIRIEDADGRREEVQLPLVIAPSNQPLGLDPIPAVNAEACAAFRVDLSARDGSRFDYQWGLEDAPRGVDVRADGTPSSVLAGVLEEGTYTFQVRVTDSSGQVARRVVVIEVTAPPQPRPRWLLTSNQAFVDTCARQPFVAGSVRRPRTHDVAAVFSKGPGPSWLGLSRTATTGGREMLLVEPPGTTVWPVPHDGTLRSSAGRPKMTVASPGSGQVEVYYEVERSLPADPIPVQRDFVARVAIDAVAGPGLPQLLPAREDEDAVLGELDASGRQSYRSRNSWYQFLFEPGGPGALATGAELLGPGADFIGFGATGARAFSSEGATLYSARLLAPTSPILVTVQANLQGIELAPSGRRLATQTSAGWSVYDVEQPGPLGSPQPLTGSAACAGPPAFSASGHLFACRLEPAQRPNDEVLHVWQLEPFDPLPRSLTPTVALGGYARDIYPSPNGAHVVFVGRVEAPPTPEVFALDLSRPGRAHQLTTPLPGSNASYSVRFAPNGHYVAISRSGHLWVHDLDAPQDTLLFYAPNAPAYRGDWRSDSSGLVVDAQNGPAWLDLTVPEDARIIPIDANGASLGDVIAAEE